MGIPSRARVFAETEHGNCWFCAIHVEAAKTLFVAEHHGPGLCQGFGEHCFAVAACAA
jgi:hypothetical protein